jgi:hypothetical protein
VTDTDEPLRIDERYPWSFGYLSGYAEDAIRALEGNPVGDQLRDALARARAVARGQEEPS